jgi:predicted metal-binding protein
MGTHGTYQGSRWTMAGKQYEEAQVCLDCPIRPDCVGRENPECPLRAAELAEKVREENDRTSRS